ncbi:MAG: hypothetical protein KDD11_19205 [Acidobacteria bacterium]|nr:hypothetical protein [Acidobacteriota bacterium]
MARRVIVSVGLVVFMALVASAQVDLLKYGQRAHRWEGVRNRPVSGFDVELLGVQAQGDENLPDRFDDQVSARFYLDARSPLYFVARERFPKTYYWLDRVEPARTWDQRNVNIFSWPAGDVLRPLGLDPSDLVFLARLDWERPRRQEHVAPVLLSERRQEISSYRFTFKTNSRAKVRARVFAANGTHHWQSGALTEVEGDTPFDLVWPCSDQPDGTYRLVLEGYFLRDNSKVSQEVTFTHLHLL